MSGLDRRRTAASLRITGLGMLAGLLLALAVGLAGGRGSVGAAVFLLVGALSAGLGGLHAVGALLLDDLRDRQPSVWRGVLAGGLFALGAVLMAMVAGLGG